jgi:C1A family cysteine protease
MAIKKGSRPAAGRSKRATKKTAAKPKRPASATATAKKKSSTPVTRAAAATSKAKRFLTRAQFNNVLEEFARETNIRVRDISRARPEATRVRRAKRAAKKATTAAAPETGFDPCLPNTTTRLGTPIRNQQDSDLCIAFAVAAAMETAICRNRNDIANTPEINADHVFRKNGAQVGSVVTIQGAVASGVLDVTCLPFGQAQPCAQPAPHTWKCDLRAVQAFPSARIQVMKEQLRNVGPLVSLIQVFANFANYSKTTPYTSEGTATAGFHAVCIVGFEVDGNGGGRWIAKNSMGPGWGDQGFFRIDWGQPDVRPEDVVFVAANVRQ